MSSPPAWSVMGEGFGRSFQRFLTSHDVANDQIAVVSKIAPMGTPFAIHSLNNLPDRAKRMIDSKMIQALIRWILFSEARSSLGWLFGRRVNASDSFAVSSNSPLSGGPCFVRVNRNPKIKKNITNNVPAERSWIVP